MSENIASGAAPGDAPSRPQSADEQGTGAVGNGEHVVRVGECISSIARNTGHFWETIWKDAGNAELKQARQDPNILLEGDRVHVPELHRKQEPGETEMHHRFRRKGEPAKLRLRLLRETREEERGGESPESQQVSADGRTCQQSLDEEQRPPVEDEPRTDVPYVLVVDGRHYRGATDADGRLEVAVPGNARQARLILNPGTDDQEEFLIQLGHLNPITETAGIKERLANLSFECGDRSDEVTESLRRALGEFQAKHGLEVTGELNERTRQKIREQHGS